MFFKHKIWESWSSFTVLNISSLDLSCGHVLNLLEKSNENGYVEYGVVPTVGEYWKEEY